MKHAKAKDIMTSPAVTVSRDTVLQDAAEIMLQRKIGSVVVVDEDGRVEGIVTDSDFSARDAHIPFSTFRAPQVLGHWLDEAGLERVFERARRRRAASIMSAPVITVAEEDGLDRVLHLMHEHGIKRVVVADDGRPVGVVARHDLLKLLLRHLS